jgi:hypothetical protein
MKKLILIGTLFLGGILASAFSFQGTKPGDPNKGNALVAGPHVPFYAVFDADSFYCDPAEAKHHGKVFHRYNTLHMREKGPDNIIVHFKSKKYTAKDGKPDNDYVHFDILFEGGVVAKRMDTHLVLTWKGKKYHLKDNACKFNITSLTWKDDKQNFTFNADFEARVTAGGSDTTTHIFKGQIVDELVKAKATAPQK